MSETMKILLGSCCQVRAQHVCSKIEKKATYTVAESWSDFETESKKRSYSIHITDLSFSDCFEFVALDNICNLETLSPTIIIIKNIENYHRYRSQARPDIEIYPVEIVDDENFFAILVSLQTKFKYLSDLL